MLYNSANEKTGYGCPQMAKKCINLSWNIGVSKQVRTRTGPEKIENIHRDIRLHWHGNVIQMDHQCTPHYCTGRFWDSHEDQISQGQAGEVQSRKTYKDWDETDAVA